VKKMHRFLLLANPRTGSTYLATLLRSHPDVGLAGELLNDEHELPDDKLQYIEQQLSKMEQNFVGFKVFPEQIFKRELRFDDIVRYIGVKYVVVLWRKSLIEQLISRRIAEKTGIWFCGPQDNNDNPKEKVSINENDLKEYYETLESEWKLIGSQWPTDVLPIFISYEDLMFDPIRELRRIFARMSCDIEKYAYVDAGQRKIQVNASDRVQNWIEIKPELKNLELSADQILTEMINKSFKVQFEALPLVPDREPSMPSTGWRYNVCSPFMPNKAKENVMNALYSGSVSSAGFWPKLMAKKLKQLFGVPVAQPCSNGFTSLLLAMQSVNIGKGDEVIMPSMTMIAVPNAVHFLGAVPVFAECAIDNYNPGLKEILDAATGKELMINLLMCLLGF
jgi:LPS sulfotransferase NodH